jgi:hypothetical protein
MGRELMKCDTMFSHELIKESPFFQISGDGLLTNRKVAVSTGLLQSHPVRFLAHPLGPLLETHQ